MKQLICFISIAAMLIGVSLMCFPVSGEEKTLIYNIDFEEENAGTVLVEYDENGQKNVVGEVVEWPVGSGNHAVKYVLGSYAYHRAGGIHPFVFPDGMSDILAMQGQIPTGGKLVYSVDLGCDDKLVKDNEYIGQPLLLNGTGIFGYSFQHVLLNSPGVGCFNTLEYSATEFDVPMTLGNDNGGIAFWDAETFGSAMWGKPIYYDNIKLEWYGAWTAVHNRQLTYIDTGVRIARSDVNDVYWGSPKTTKTHATTVRTTTTQNSPRIDSTLIYNIDFEEVCAGSVLQFDGKTVGEVVEWPVGSGNHALKYIMRSYDMATYEEGEGRHPFITLKGLDKALASQINIPKAYELYFSAELGTDDEIVTGDGLRGAYIYPKMRISDDRKEPYSPVEYTYIHVPWEEEEIRVIPNEDQFVPGVGCFRSKEWFLGTFTSSPVTSMGNGLIAFFDDGTIGAGMREKAIYYDNIKLEWRGPWTTVTDCLLTYLNSDESVAQSDINDAYLNSSKSSTTSTKQTPTKAPEVVQIKGGEVQANQGDLVMFPFYITNNPGFSEFTVEFKYDSTSLTFKRLGSATSAFSDMTFDTVEGNGSVKVHGKMASGNTTQIGVPIALQFQVLPNAKSKEYAITLYTSGSYWSSVDKTYVVPMTENGKIIVGETGILLGDANEDGEIDMKDVLAIRKALAGLSDIRGSKSADANKDGSLDMKDVLLVRKYLAHMAEL